MNSAVCVLFPVPYNSARKYRYFSFLESLGGGRYPDRVAWNVSFFSLAVYCALASVVQLSFTYCREAIYLMELVSKMIMVTRPHSVGYYVTLAIFDYGTLWLSVYVASSICNSWLGKSVIWFHNVKGREYLGKVIVVWDIILKRGCRQLSQNSIQAADVHA
jgi:hypothetical protein